MRKIIFLFLLVSFLVKLPLSAQDYDYRKSLYKRKTESYMGMKKIGTLTGAIGASTYSYSETTPDNQEKLIKGIACVCIGIPLLATGIVLHSVGSMKSKQYSEKLRNLSISANYSPYQKGIVIKYRF